MFGAFGVNASLLNTDIGHFSTHIPDTLFYYIIAHQYLIPAIEGGNNIELGCGMNCIRNDLVDDPAWWTLARTFSSR